MQQHAVRARVASPLFEFRVEGAWIDPQGRQGALGPGPVHLLGDDVLLSHVPLAAVDDPFHQALLAGKGQEVAVDEQEMLRGSDLPCSWYLTPRYSRVFQAFEFLALELLLIDTVDQLLEKIAAAGPDQQQSLFLFGPVRQGRPVGQHDGVAEDVVAQLDPVDAEASLQLVVEQRQSMQFRSVLNGLAQRGTAHLLDPG